MRQAVVERRDFEVLSLPAILLLERSPSEAAFVWSVVRDVMRADLWLWHEADLQHALHLLSYCRFRLILLDSAFGRRISPRTLVRRITGAARGTPIILRAPSEDLLPDSDPRLYGVAAVAPKGLGGPTERAIRQLLGLA